MNTYWIEHLCGGRAQAWCDTLDAPGGTVEATFRVGSPAPTQTVEAAVAVLNARA